MNQPTILVTGATGNAGRPLIADLLAAGARVRALTRKPAAAGLPPQVEVSGGDYAALGVLADAVRGADAVFVNIGAIRDGLGDLLAAARDAGVSKIVLLSSTTVRDHGEQDTAAAAVRVLLDPGHGDQTYYLTGPESLTQIRQAVAIGTATGRPVRFEELSPETFRQYATQRFRAPVVDDLLRNWAQSVGQTADIAPDLEKIIGRPATTYAQWAARHADAYR